MVLPVKGFSLDTEKTVSPRQDGGQFFCIYLAVLGSSRHCCPATPCCCSPYTGIEKAVLAPEGLRSSLRVPPLPGLPAPMPRLRRAVRWQRKRPAGEDCAHPWCSAGTESCSHSLQQAAGGDSPRDCLSFSSRFAQQNKFAASALLHVAK